MNKIKTLNQLRWIFEPVSWLNDSYYITNVKYNQHLCASHIYADFSRSTKKRRLVELSTINRDSLITNKKCIWKPEQLNQNDQFYLWNLYYKESLYAASVIKFSKKNDRSVFLWYKDPDSMQFVWYIYCSKAFKIDWN